MRFLWNCLKLWNNFKNDFFENDERLLKSKGGWKGIEYFYKWVSGCGFRCFSRWNLLTSVGGFTFNFTIFRWFDATQLVFSHFIIFDITVFLVMQLKRESTSFLMVARSHALGRHGGKDRMLSFKSIWESCLRVLRIWSCLICVENYF